MVTNEFVDLCEKFKLGDDFSRLLRESAIALSLQERALAELVEVTPSTMSRWLAGTTVPHLLVQRSVHSILRKKLLRFGIHRLVQAVIDRNLDEGHEAGYMVMTLLREKPVDAPIELTTGELLFLASGIHELACIVSAAEETWEP